MGGCPQRTDLRNDDRCGHDHHSVKWQFITPLVRPRQIHRTGHAFRSTSHRTTTNCCFPHPVLSRVLDVTFTSLVCIHTTFTVSSFGFGLARGSAVGIHRWLLPLSLSLLKLRWRSRGQYTSLPPSTAHVFSTRYTIYRMYAKGGRNVPRTRSVFYFLDLGYWFVLLLYTREPLVVHYKYTPMKRQVISQL